MFALTMTESPLSLGPEWQDLLLGSSLWAKRIFDFSRGVSTEVLPCSHPAFGDTQSFAKQGVSVLKTGSIQSIYFYLFF